MSPPRQRQPSSSRRSSSGAQRPRAYGERPARAPRAEPVLLPPAPRTGRDRGRDLTAGVESQARAKARVRGAVRVQRQGRVEDRVRGHVGAQARPCALTRAHGHQLAHGRRGYVPGGGDVRRSRNPGARRPRGLARNGAPGQAGRALHDERRHPVAYSRTSTGGPTLFALSATSCSRSASRRAIEASYARSELSAMPLSTAPMAGVICSPQDQARDLVQEGRDGLGIAELRVGGVGDRELRVEPAPLAPRSPLSRRCSPRSARGTGCTRSRAWTRRCRPSRSRASPGTVGPRTGAPPGSRERVSRRGRTWRGDGREYRRPRSGPWGLRPRGGVPARERRSGQGSSRPRTGQGRGHSTGAPLGLGAWLGRRGGTGSGGGRRLWFAGGGNRVNIGQEEKVLVLLRSWEGRPYRGRPDPPVRRGGSSLPSGKTLVISGDQSPLISGDHPPYRYFSVP